MLVYRLRERNFLYKAFFVWLRWCTLFTGCLSFVAYGHQIADSCEITAAIPLDTSALLRMLWFYPSWIISGEILQPLVAGVRALKMQGNGPFPEWSRWCFYLRLRHSNRSTTEPHPVHVAAWLVSLLRWERIRSCTSTIVVRGAETRHPLHFFLWVGEGEASLRAERVGTFKSYLLCRHLPSVIGNAAAVVVLLPQLLLSYSLSPVMQNVRASADQYWTFYIQSQKVQQHPLGASV